MNGILKMSDHAKSVHGGSLVAPQGKWTWADGAGPQSGVAVVAFFTALAVVSGCVLLAVLFKPNQYFTEKFPLSGILQKTMEAFGVAGTFHPGHLYVHSFCMHICISLCSQSSVCPCPYLIPHLTQGNAECNALKRVPSYTETDQKQL